MSTLWIIILLSIVYLGLLLQLKKGWSKTNTFTFRKTNSEHTFTIIIPFRNESGNIDHLLKSLRNIDYPEELFNVFLVNDFSTDNSALEIENYINLYQKSNYTLIHLTENEGFGKKAAITKAVSLSKMDWIVCSDADCILPSNWLKILATFIDTNNVEMVSMPVCFSDKKSFFDKIQYLEFSSLVGMGASLIELKIPYLCNGANLAYSRKAFLAVNGFSGNEHIASGDDIFLMKKINKHFPEKIKFLKNLDCCVYTNPKASFLEFLSQRKRWVSKTTNESFFRLLFPLFIWFYHVLILGSAVLAFFNPLYIKSFICLFLAKILGEYFFVRGIIQFFKQKNILRYYFPSAIIYVVYVSFLPILALFSKNEWKNRKI